VNAARSCKPVACRNAAQKRNKSRHAATAQKKLRRNIRDGGAVHLDTGVVSSRIRHRRRIRMKKIAILASLLLAWPALAQDGGPFRAALSGYDEVPSVSTAASGTFEARRNGSSVDYTLAYTGLQAPAVMAHIHFAQKGVNGSVIVWLCGSEANPGPAGTAACPATAGTVSGTFTSANVLASSSAQQLAAGDLEALIDAMLAGAAYVNVHTTVSPGGEIRGQLGARGQSGR
jgi:hypothetical protein